MDFDGVVMTHRTVLKFIIFTAVGPTKLHFDLKHNARISVNFLSEAWCIMWLKCHKRPFSTVQMLFAHQMLFASIKGIWIENSTRNNGWNVLLLLPNGCGLWQLCMPIFDRLSNDTVYNATMLPIIHSTKFRMRVTWVLYSYSECAILLFDRLSMWKKKAFWCIQFSQNIVYVRFCICRSM